jgi:hypothetical protein
MVPLKESRLPWPWLGVAIPATELPLAPGDRRYFTCAPPAVWARCGGQQVRTRRTCCQPPRNEGAKTSAAG